MKILVLPLSYSLFRNPFLSGGDRTHIIEFANALSSMPGVIVTLLYPQAADRSQLAKKVRLIDLTDKDDSSIGKGKFGILLWFRLICRLVWRLSLTRQTYDLIYVRFASSGLLPLLLLRFRSHGIPIVLEINTPAMINLAGILGHIIDWLALRLCWLIVVVSRDLAQLLIQRYGKDLARRLIINPNGADPDRFQPLGRPAACKFRQRYALPQESFIVGYSGVALPHHRLELVARTVARLGKEAQLVIAGDTSQIDIRQIKEAAQGQVSLLGQLPYAQLVDFLNACDVLVLPHGPSYGSILHQSPIKLFEYLAMARPVVASRIGQIAEVVENGNNGLLFDWRSEEDFFRQLLRLKQNPELGHQLGINGRTTVQQHFTWQANARRLLQRLAPLFPQVVLPQGAG